MLPSKEKDPITSVLPRESLWEKENKAEACLHTSLADPRRSMPSPGLNPSAPAKPSSPDLELCHGAHRAPHSCKTPPAPPWALPCPWDGAGDAALWGSRAMAAVWVRLPQPRDPAVNSFVSFLYRILLPKKENEVGGEREKKG